MRHYKWAALAPHSRIRPMQQCMKCTINFNSEKNCAPDIKSLGNTCVVLSTKLFSSVTRAS